MGSLRASPNLNLKMSFIQHMKPQALGRTNIRGLTRTNDLIIRKKTIHVLYEEYH